MHSHLNAELIRASQQARRADSRMAQHRLELREARRQERRTGHTKRLAVAFAMALTRAA